MKRLLAFTLLTSACTTQVTTERPSPVDAGPTEYSESGILSTFDDSVALEGVFATAGPITITFSTTETLDSNSYPILLDADIDFTVLGISAHRRMTVLDGASITGGADTVSVKVTAKPAYVPPYWPEASMPSAVPVSFTVAPSSRTDLDGGCLDVDLPCPPHTPPILLVQNTGKPESAAPSEWTVAPNSSVSIDIPQNVGAVSAMVFLVRTSHLGGYAPDALDKLLVSERVTKDATYDLARLYPKNEWFPLVAGADNLTIYNLDTVEGYLVRPVFGIDG